MKIGIFGGSFDPVHTGHLILADQLREAAGLDKVIFVPAYRSPFKAGLVAADEKPRLEMLRLATEDCPYFEVSDVELGKAAPSYTIDTLEYFAEKFENDEISFIIGADAFLDVDKWHRADELLGRFKFIAGCRKGWNSGEAMAKLAELRGKYAAEIEFHEIPEIEISSKVIRGRLAEGRSVKFLVPNAVLKYIYDNGVYVSLIEKLREYARECEEPLRFKHTEGTVKKVARLAERYGMDSYRAQIAAWFHDTYKPAGPLEHGRIAAEALKRDFGIEDPEILEAIEYHTTGKPGMSDIAKLLKLADMTEENRDYPGVERIRAAINDDLDESLLMLMKETRKYVLENGGTFARISDETISELEREIERKRKETL